MKVLQILGGLTRGGMETFIMNIYRTIDRNEIQFDFLLRSPGGDYESEAKKLGANIYYSGARNAGFLSYYKRLDLFFKEHKDDYCAVHCHVSTLSNIEVLFFAKKYGVPVRILHSHSSSVSGNKLHYVTHSIFKIFVKYLATNYLGCSEKANQWLYKYTGVYNKAIMLPNGIDVSKYTYNPSCRQYIRNSLNIGDNSFVIGHVGRFVWIKNHKFLIDIFESIQSRVSDSILLLIGTGDLCDATKEYVNSKGLNEKVKFLGSRSDVSDVLQAMDVFVMPSFYEGLPVSLVEAQASGLLVIGSDTISKDSTLTENIQYLSLDMSSESWASSILTSFEKHDRKNMEKKIQEKGFDVRYSCKLLRDIYLGKND